MRRLALGALGERVDDMLRRPGLGIAAPEVDERLAVGAAAADDASEQRAEVLLGKPLEALGRRPHRRIVLATVASL